jgi:hypothetical protein
MIPAFFSASSRNGVNSAMQLRPLCCAGGAPKTGRVADGGQAGPDCGAAAGACGAGDGADADEDGGDAGGDD